MNNVVKSSWKTRETTITGLMVAFLCISSYISFPIPFTPIMITAQTIIINLIALTLDPKKASFAIIVFIFIGAIGVPVFSGGSAGVGVLVGPTGGYFVGFIVAACIISYFRKNSISLKKYLVLTILVGMPIIYFFGAAWMSYYNGAGIITTIKVAILPFLPGDIIKCTLASFIAVKLNKVFWKDTIR